MPIRLSLIKQGDLTRMRHNGTANCKSCGKPFKIGDYRVIKKQGKGSRCVDCGKKLKMI